MGKEYTYWIKACNTAGCSGFSVCDSGYLEVVIFNQFLYLPLTLIEVAVIPGFDSQFNGDSEGWVVHSGKWINYENKHIYTDGVPGSISSISYDADFTNLDYRVQLYRYGANTNANRIIIRGTPSPLSGIKDWYNQYLFQYTRNGYYSVFKFVEGEIFTLKDWTFSDAVNQANSWNMLRVVGEGGKFTFYINGKQVWSGTDSSLTSGRVGIGMYRDYESTDNRLYVDWAKVTTEGLGGADASTSVDFVMPEQGGLLDAIDPEDGADPNRAPMD